jgi:hypothetical protein
MLREPAYNGMRIDCIVLADTAKLSNNSMRAERRPRIYVHVVFDDGAWANQDGRIDLRLP